jgi:uncharacterized membrane protein YhhN
MFLEILVEFFKLETLVFILKPAVTTLLIVFFWTETKDKPTRFSKAIFFALIFSLGGDILLMFPRFNEIFFLLGLGSFLIAHIFYIVAFVGNIRSSTYSNSFTIKALTFNPFLLLTLMMFGIIHNHLGEMKIPVIAYMTAITLMGVSAALRVNHTSAKSWKLIVAGALIFTLSDSMIALNKFVVVFPGAQVAIMVSYYLAQYLMVSGALVHFKLKK